MNAQTKQQTTAALLRHALTYLDLIPVLAKQGFLEMVSIAQVPFPPFPQVLFSHHSPSQISMNAPAT